MNELENPKAKDNDTNSILGKNNPQKNESAKDNSLEGEFNDSQMVLSHLRKRYSKEIDNLKELKNKKMESKAAVVMTKRRYRGVLNALKKNGQSISKAVLNTKEESVKLLDMTKGRIRICKINKLIDKSLLQLGNDVYDLFKFGSLDIFNNKNIAKTLKRINEHNLEIELICKKFESNT